MDTVRVDICYRPLRIGWVIRAGDLDAFRQAVRLSHAMWGGRFNPIIVMDKEEEARRLVDLYRVDLLWEISETDQTKAFRQKFPHLISPFFHHAPFLGGGKERPRAQLLDIHNALVHLGDSPGWKAIKQRGMQLHTWQAQDPLADVFLIQLGAYPNHEETGMDYRTMLMETAEATEHQLDSGTVIPADVLEHPGIAYLSRHGLKRHYSVEPGWKSPGFFVGDVNSVDDLVCHWNLRAADIPLWFVDPNHLSRYANIIPAWEKSMREMVASWHEWDRHVAVWSRRADIDEACKPFGEMHVMRCLVSEGLWNGHNVRAPMMHLGQASVLGVMSHESGKPKISFSLSDKPFSGESWFHTQHLVASVSFGGGLFGDEQHTLNPPYLPELNEFYARSMHFHYNKLRIEPGRLGLIIDAADHDSFLYALPVADMVDRMFDMAGFSSKLSSGGLITRQLISRLGGVGGARPFKIPGVRRLLKTYGPTDAFTKGGALQLIGSKDPDNPDADFRDYEELYIEQRPIGTKLQPADVFAYLVEKGLFRIGAQLTCPNCRMSSWTALDALKQRALCELCGYDHDATRQLVNGEWHYRRTGILGVEKNAQGAVPVMLTLQQLETNFHGALHESAYSPSLDLTPKDGEDLPKCEVDFVWIIPRTYPRKTVVILGECKDQGPIDPKEFKKDIENLRRVADALPRKRFKTFVLLTKLSPFTPEEVELALALRDRYRQRAILLTSRELEPYHIYERTKLEIDGVKAYGGSPEDLAEVTAQIYFGGRSVSEE
jgi:hypothetical protein